MSTQLVDKKSGQVQAFESLLIQGDLSRLNHEQRCAYYSKVCESLNLNPLTQPFEFIKMNGKEVLYAKRSCTEQLRKNHGVSLTVVSRDKIDDLYVVTARAIMPDGRTDESVGAVSIVGLKGENLANAMMKAETKAKRRVTLSICGLSFIDESEISQFTNLQPKATAYHPAPKIISSSASVKANAPGQIDSEKFPWERVPAEKQDEDDATSAPANSATGKSAPEDYVIPFGEHAGHSLKSQPKEFWVEYHKKVAAKFDNLPEETKAQAHQVLVAIEKYVEPQ